MRIKDLPAGREKEEKEKLTLCLLFSFDLLVKN